MYYTLRMLCYMGKDQKGTTYADIHTCMSHTPLLICSFSPNLPRFIHGRLVGTYNALEVYVDVYAWVAISV